MLKKLWHLLPRTRIDYCESAWTGFLWERGWIFNKIIWTQLVPDAMSTIKFTPRSKRKTEVTKMNRGDKVIAVGMGRKTKELNEGDIKRPSKKLPGFTGLVVDMVVMTVTEIDGDTVSTANYTFHKDDLHLVDTGRAAAPLA
jgi:hypothetical protein